jgi:hypothetical protein
MSFIESVLKMSRITRTQRFQLLFMTFFVQFQLLISCSLDLTTISFCQTFSFIVSPSWYFEFVLGLPKIVTFQKISFIENFI